jgi:DNA-binding transcriptional MerR regulator
MRLKTLYSSREVAALTGLSARQLQWWDRHRLFSASVPSHRTDAGGFTERRYTPIELLELMVLADLRRRGFSIARLRRLLTVLKTRFNTRLYEAIEGSGPVTLYIDGNQIYARTPAGDLYNVLENASQPLLMLGEDLKLRQLTAKEGRRRPAGGAKGALGKPKVSKRGAKKEK